MLILLDWNYKTFLFLNRSEWKIQASNRIIWASNTNSAPSTR